MTDRHRFDKRFRELNERAQFVEDLARMPDRANEQDFRQTADLMRGAATDLEELTKATPTGCICRRIEHDNYSYLNYAEACLHHRQLYVWREKLKEDYEKMEKTLKNEVRIKLVVAALSGSATLPSAADLNHYVKQAVAIADETIRCITETA